MLDKRQETKDKSWHFWGLSWEKGHFGVKARKVENGGAGMDILTQLFC